MFPRVDELEQNELGMATLTRKYKHYPAYEPSGVEWLGKIPAHWEVKRLKYLGELQGGAGFPHQEQWDTTQEFPFFKVGDMAVDGNHREMTKYQHTVSRDTAIRLGAYLFPPSTIVFAKVGAALMLNRRRMIVRLSCIDNNMMGFIPHVPDPDWMMYWLSGLDLGKLANPGAVPSVNEGQMREQEVVIPPLPEQQAIAAFLDRETARIDALVAKKERLIELLQEKRTALITRAVTRGLDPDAPMKDSGVKWLGKIPAHWEVKRLKYLGELQGGAGFPHQEQWDTTQEFPFFKVGDMAVDGNHREMTKYQHTVSRDTAIRLGAYLFPPSTIVFAKVGAALMLNRRRMIVRLSCIDNNMMGFIPHVPDPDWMMYWLSGLDLGKLANPGAVPSVNEGQMREQEVVIPPLPEQQAIAAFLDRETARIDALVAKKERLIELLQEKRTALITRAVTRGLDPNAPMKDSGVEWLGEIPAHWGVTKLRRLITPVAHPLKVDPEQVYQEIGIRSWGRGIFHKDPIAGVDLGDKRVFKLRPGELVLNIVFAWEGAVAVISEREKEMVASHRFPTFQHDATVADLDYLLMFLQSEHGWGLMGLNSPGAAGRNRTIRIHSFLEEELPIPPIKEQREIVAFYRTEEHRLQSLSEKVKEAIDRLRELRNALISAAVTGQIDVREEAGCK